MRKHDNMLYNSIDIDNRICVRIIKEHHNYICRLDIGLYFKKLKIFIRKFSIIADLYSTVFTLQYFNDSNNAVYNPGAGHSLVYFKIYLTLLSGDQS